MTFELCFVSVNFRLNFVRWFLWNDNEWSQGVHLDSWILLAKLNYALGNYTDSLKYYEKAQVEHIEDISKRQLEATCLERLFICADREPRGKAIACEVSQDHG